MWAERRLSGLVAGALLEDIPPLPLGLYTEPHTRHPRTQVKTARLHVSPDSPAPGSQGLDVTLLVALPPIAKVIYTVYYPTAAGSRFCLANWPCSTPVNSPSGQYPAPVLYHPDVSDCGRASDLGSTHVKLHRNYQSDRTSGRLESTAVVLVHSLYAVQSW